MHDTVEFVPGGFLRIVLSNGWQGLVAMTEVASVKARREGGAIIHMKSVDHPGLVSVAIEDVIDAMKKGVADASS